eukprot:8703280-Ditylum_brightwellii.AAC.1
MDSDEEKILITDICAFNCCKNTDESKYEPFWNVCKCTLDLENGSGAHHCRHAGPNAETTNNVSFAPAILTIPQLIRATVKSLTDGGKVVGKDFEVPVKSWVSHQMSPNNAYAKNAARYTGRLPFVWKMISRNAHDGSHPCGYWCADLKKNWWFHQSHLIQFIGKFLNLNLDCNDVESCLPATAAIICAGCDDKTSANVGKLIPLEAATSRQSNHAIVNADTSIEAGDHSFTCLRLTPSIIHVFNQSTNPGESIYSGGPDGTGHTFVNIELGKYHLKTLRHRHILC